MVKLMEKPMTSSNNFETQQKLQQPTFDTMPFLQPTIEDEVATGHVSEAAPITQLDHMMIYGRGVVAATVDKLRASSDSVAHHMHVPRAVTTAALTASLAVGATAASASTAVANRANPNVFGESHQSPIDFASSKNRVKKPKPKLWITNPFSPLDIKLDKKFLKESKGLLPVASYPFAKRRNDVKPYAQIKYTRLNEEEGKFTWKYKQGIKLVAVKEEFSDGKVRYTQNYRQKNKRGSFIVTGSGAPKKVTSLEEINNERIHTAVKLYLKKDK